MIVAKDKTPIGQGDSTEVTKTSHVKSQQNLATKMKIGMRMPSFKVLNQSDARPWHLQELLKSDGRWRLIIFAGDLTSATNLARIKKLGLSLSSDESFLRKFTPKDKPIDSVIEVLTVHSGPRYGVELLDLPETFHPWSESEGWDYWKVFVDDESYHEGHGHAYENYGVDKRLGAAVIVRPDQYVSWVGEADDFDAMDGFFGGFMKKRNGLETNDVGGRDAGSVLAI